MVKLCLISFRSAKKLLFPHLTSTTSATARREDEQPVPLQHLIWGTTDAYNRLIEREGSDFVHP
jgi:hypothetical protein